MLALGAQTGPVFMVFRSLPAVDDVAARVAAELPLYDFVAPDGAWYGKFAEHYAKTRMLDRIVELVGKARAKGVLVVHITEGYSSDFREHDPTNPGMFHRGQIGRGAWKIGSSSPWS